MLLIEIDKNRYRRHFNIVLGGVVGLLATGSLLVAQLLIYFFPSDQGTHFHWNLAGVVVTVLLIASLLKHYKDHPFLREVFYVWQLKQALNLVSRKMLKLQTAAKMGSKEAMLALQFSYTGSRQLWMLDDNTITLNSLDESQRALDALLVKYNLSLDLDQYQNEILKSF